MEEPNFTFLLWKYPNNTALYTITCDNELTNQRPYKYYHKIKIIVVACFFVNL